MSDHDSSETSETNPPTNDAGADMNPVTRDPAHPTDAAGQAQAPDDEHDQDSEPTMNAPQEGRPDGLVALDDDDSTGGDGSPS